ncbi:ArgE/DapE family deacylase [Neisseria perflava]|uniref:ArgE/DapE family deacylase n=1 Tax=Neisseria perflava TaxID=33053 RepID=UPI00209DCF38|nr:ArgE/DapE family deacylase [Neisseria perflava]MCP1659804.1 succinyl-diaminopimelate desuccinylase [Neisseria perflava]MCP1771597.1 succinyl-diaminopimelate desuccinylase [Neisseria perflava]
MKKFTEQEKLDLLKDLVAMKSVNDNEIEVAEYLKKLFAQYGIDSQIIPVTEKRVNLVAQIGSGKPVIGISGHMDVVSPGNLDDWDTDPFELVEKDGKLFGRGTNDMKAGLLDLAIALIELKENNTLPKGTVKFMATTGEEVGAAGSKKLYEEGYMQDVECLWVAEPSCDVIIYSHKGSLNFKITSLGVAAHSSMPDKGYNAINPLMAYLLEVDKICNGDTRSNEILGRLVMSTTIIEGGTQVNSIPDKAVAQINCRTIPEFDNDEVIQIFQDLAAKYNAERGSQIQVEVTMSLPSVFTTGKSKMVDLTIELSKKYFGKDVTIQGSTGVTDASNLLRGKGKDFPFMMFGPGETFMAHKANEYVWKENYLKFSDFYQDLIIGLTQD